MFNTVGQLLSLAMCHKYMCQDKHCKDALFTNIYFVCAWMYPCMSFVKGKCIRLA